MTNSTAKHTVLIIDDAPENIEVLNQILYEKNLNIAISQHGKEALKIVSGNPPDLILLDIMMPDMDGFQVCKELKQRPATRDIPIIFLSARTASEDIVKGFELGAVDYITKPFHAAEVVARVLTQLELKKARDLMSRENRQHKTLLENILESLTHPFYVIDASDYTIQIANTASQLAGSTTCYGLSHHRDIPCEGREHPCPLQQVKDTGKPVTVEHLHFDQTGQLRYMEIHGYPMLDDDGRVAQMIEYALDITERKLAEEALRTSEQQYRILAEHVADGIGIIQDGKLVFANEALAAMLGSSLAEIVGKSPGDVFQSPAQEDFRKLYQSQEFEASAPQGWPVLQCVMNNAQQEIWMEGRHSPISWEGKPAVLMTMRDITKRKLREIAIEEERNTLRRENLQLRSSMKDRYRFGEIIGKSQVMQAVYELILKAAAAEKDVLIYGESGTGKELVARTIHQLSGRQPHAFVPVNCGAIPETLFEREFFGHRKGAFTGAEQDKQGLFEAANRGTLFLDEVGELRLAMQVKLLRAIETGEYTPIGANHPTCTNVRIISATHCNLADMVAQGLMREDFFYRLHVIVITIPPLRERKEDIPLLVDHFMKYYAETNSPSTLPGHILEALYSHDWPGNIRQLQHTISRYLTVGRLDFISPRSVDALETVQDGVLFRDATEAFEKRLLIQTLNRHQWNQSQTAASLGMTRQSLLRRIEKYHLKPDYLS